MTQSRDSRFWPKRISRDTVLLYGQAVQLIAGADGKLSIAELEFFYEDARRRGISDSVLEEWRGYQWSEGDLSKVVKSLRPLLSPRLRKLLLFDSIRIAIEDANYPLEEQDAVRRAADILEIDDKTVVELETLASLDKNVADLKRITFLDIE